MKPDGMLKRTKGKRGNDMTSKKAIGEVGERAAADYLEKVGYRIVDKNYRTRVGEIDIVAYDGQVLAFVEVKSRSNTRYGTPAEAVGTRKQKKLISVALLYISRNRPYYSNIRFDVVEVIIDRDRINKICLIKDAFRGIGGSY
jgi:putative endonuclease